MSRNFISQSLSTTNVYVFTGRTLDYVDCIFLITAEISIYYVVMGFSKDFPSVII